MRQRSPIRSVGRAAIAALAILAIVPAAALAHPLGNFTINHFAGLHVERDGVVLDVVIDSAEIPAFQERQRIDADGDGTLSVDELAAEREAACPRLGRSLQVSADGRALALQAFAAGLSFPPGAGGLVTMRLVCEYRASFGGSMPSAVGFTDASYAERIGWREVIAVGDGVTLDGGIPSASVSARLTQYPKGLLAQPLDVRSASIELTPGGPATPYGLPSDATPLDGMTPEGPGSTAAGQTAAGPAAASTTAPGPAAAAAGAVPGGAGPEIAGLIETADLTPFALVGSLLLAAGLGALHAVSPGHGKTVMAAYLVGSRGTARHAVALGLTVTVSHTLGVLALAMITIGASSVVSPERLYPILGLASGGMVIAIGGWLLWVRYSAWRRASASDHLHESSHVHDDAGAGHEHLSEAGGTPRRDGHDHAHDDSYRHDHPHGASGPAHAPAHDPAPPSAAPEGQFHRHGGVRHRHVPPSGTTLSWRSLFSLGLAGGLVPSTSALLLLLGSLAAHRPAYGLVLVVAFGAGMAVVLGGIGLALVHAARIVERLPRGRRLERIAGFAPVASACVVVVAGLVLASQAMTQAF